MNTLEIVLSSRTRTGRFTMFSGVVHDEMHNREIAEQFGSVRVC